MKRRVRRTAQLTVVLPLTLKNRMRKAAAEAGRLISQEAAYRLQVAYDFEDVIAVENRKRGVRQVMP